jgi:hypothetical protein
MCSLTALPLFESENGHCPSQLIDQRAAHNRTFLVSDEIVDNELLLHDVTLFLLLDRHSIT